MAFHRGVLCLALVSFAAFSESFKVAGSSKPSKFKICLALHSFAVSCQKGRRLGSFELMGDYIGDYYGGY